ncbi:MAG: iron-sulfur cluster assembly scaffold protein [Neomegalonema sp.]|nr:iron-sulfur cluster assembly scaffold protein [Neomegalonema sp.]
MSQSDLIKLYSQKILALAADIPHAERLTAPDASVMKRSPLCGSTITVDVVTDAAGGLADLGMDVKACALGQASAAIFARNAIGADRAEIEAGRDALWAMLKEGAQAPQGRFAELEYLIPARDYKNRHASIMLVWEAALEALERAGAVAASR